MKVAIVAGSHRPTGRSGKVARFLQSVLSESDLRVDSWIIDLAGNPLPLWDEGVWKNTPAWQEVWGPIREGLRESDALVVVTPEWSGMVTPGVKNFLLLCGGQDIGHKPGLIVTVSAGRGGAYPVAELRMSGYKNNHVCWIPEHVIVRDAEHVMNGSEPESESDEMIRARARYSLSVLLQYASALAQVRASGVIDYQTYPYGM